MIATITPVLTGRFVRVAGAQTDLDAAMFDAVADFAVEAGLPTGSDTDVIAASRQPVSYAAAFADLSRMLGIAPPVWVWQALE